MKNEHTSLEKYTSHTLFSKGLQKGCLWEVSWRRNRDCNILTPSSFDYSSTSFLILLGCSIGGPEVPIPLLGAGFHCLELQLELQLTDSNYGTDFDTQLLLVSVASAPNSTRPHVKVISGCLRPDTLVSWLMAGSKVNMLPSLIGCPIHSALS